MNFASKNNNLIQNKEKREAEASLILIEQKVNDFVKKGKYL